MKQAGAFGEMTLFDKPDHHKNLLTMKEYSALVSHSSSPEKRITKKVYARSKNKAAEYLKDMGYDLLGEIEETK